jgi:hypothetical protein
MYKKEALKHVLSVWILDTTNFYMPFLIVKKRPLHANSSISFCGE